MTKNNLNFKNPKLLTIALTHRSALNETKNLHHSYERLEFLGDAVLELIVSDYLYQTYPQKEEGDLTHLRSEIVQTKTLAQASLNLKLDQQLILSAGERRSGGFKNQSLLADVFESITGAIFLDQGLAAAKAFVFKNLLKPFARLKQSAQITDYKSLLQEKWQAQKKAAPVYKVVSAVGPDHDKTFTVKVYLSGKPFATGIAKSKKEGQQLAAKTALEKIS